MTQPRTPKGFWDELLRRRVVRTALYYVAGAWVLAQATDLLLDAFDASHYMRFVIAALVIGLPLVLALAWMFDLTPRGHRAHTGSAGPRDACCDRAAAGALDRGVALREPEPGG